MASREQGDDPRHCARSRRVEIDRVAGAAGQRLITARDPSRGRARRSSDVGYVYNRGAANLRKAQSNVVGMVINDLTNPFFAELAVGIERVFQSAGIVPFLANTAESPVRQDEVLKSMREHGVAGPHRLARRAAPTPDAFQPHRRRRGMPVVLAMRRCRAAACPLSCPTISAAPCLPTAHLIGLGPSPASPSSAASHDMVVYQRALGGYRDACATPASPPTTCSIVEAVPSRERRHRRPRHGARRCAEPPTAAVCFNDAVAFGVMLALRKRGLEPGARLRRGRLRRRRRGRSTTCRR